MHKSATRRLGSAPGQVPANKGKRYRAEVLSRVEADALIAACSAASRTGIRNRALITLLYRGSGSARPWRCARLTSTPSAAPCA